MRRKNKVKEYTLLKSNTKYVDIISNTKDEIKYIKSYMLFIQDEIDILRWMDIIDEMIIDTDITDEDIEYLNNILSRKILKDKFSIHNILNEINIIKNEELTEDKKEEKLRSLLRKCTSSGYNYNYNDPKRTTPEDLKTYTNRRWVKSIITNPVGSKR